MILVTPKQEVERKSEWFCGVNLFCSIFKVECENGVWTKIRFLGSCFLFTCGNFTLIFTVFSIFWIGFFLNGFPNPFKAHSRPSFLFEINFHFSLMVFFSSHAAIWHWFFGFFPYFLIWFFYKWFSQISHSPFLVWLFCLVNENSLNCTSGLVLLCFFISPLWFLLRPYDVTATFCSFVHAISTELHVSRHFLLLVERIFCSCAWLIFWSHLTYLTLENNFLTLKLTFIYINSKR